MKILTTIQTNTTTEKDSKQAMYICNIYINKTSTEIVTTMKGTTAVMDRTIFEYKKFNF